ncbi:MAG: hypothetical protein DMG65_26125 [Candidatus Angelobacter sp. Gp1-AA117]|nr:MAG: hypothetical protein DMG65_26125 [Candidatus Angelobacter sp. Gp1-AA117]
MVQALWSENIEIIGVDVFFPAKLLSRFAASCPAVFEARQPPAVVSAPLRGVRAAQAGRSIRCADRPKLASNATISKPAGTHSPGVDRKGAKDAKEKAELLRRSALIS